MEEMHSSESSRDEQMNDGSNSQNNQQQKQKQKRRTRHDPNHRDFLCGCQRAYLSYPALYTHIKQKHNGVPPEGTAIPQDRGRSVQRAQQQGHLNDESGSNLNDVSQNQLNNYPSAPERSYIQHLFKFLRSLSINYKKEPINQDQNQSSEQEELMKIADDERMKILANDELEYIRGYMKDKLEVTLKEEYDPIREIKKQNLNNLFMMYVSEMASYVNESILIEMTIFLIYQRRALNQQGWEILELKNEGGKQFCEENDGESALIIANNLIIDHLPDYFSKIDPQILQKFEVIGSTEEKLKNAVYLTQNFSYWLYDNHYSNAKLMIQSEEEFSLPDLPPQLHQQYSFSQQLVSQQLR